MSLRSGFSHNSKALFCDPKQSSSPFRNSSVSCIRLLLALTTRSVGCANVPRSIKQELEAAVSNLIACDSNPTLVAAINRRQQELDDITRQLLSAEPDSVSAEIGRIRQFVTGQLGDIRQLLKVDVQKAKAELQKHVTEIRMVPQVEGKKGHYIAEGEWNLLGGYGEEAGNRTEVQFRMVAGEGFEPSTFGL